MFRIHCVYMHFFFISTILHILVVRISFTYDARIQSQLPIDQVLQSLTEEIIESALNCDAISDNCISFSSNVFIDSFVFGKFM